MNEVYDTVYFYSGHSVCDIAEIHQLEVQKVIDFLSCIDGESSEFPSQFKNTQLLAKPLHLLQVTPFGSLSLQKESQLRGVLKTYIEHFECISLAELSSECFIEHHEMLNLFTSLIDSLNGYTKEELILIPDEDLFEIIKISNYWTNFKQTNIISLVPK
ncbi:hypothetical protein CW748_07250 [Alteromonadales bacterium alter-6D02]|nr:hypothetical protein CW748_07250 [Alteromonadales bacterium alter-6D02]